MKSKKYQLAPTLEVSQEKYKVFFDALDILRDKVPQIGILKEEGIQKLVKEKAQEIFNDYIGEAQAALEDSQVGIIALDMPVNNNMSPNQDAFWGSMVMMGISLNIFNPASDGLNKTPFTVYTASKENEEKLTKAGLNFHSPQHKLGFHNDGLIRDRVVYLPHHLMLYNLSISYRRPGCFYWVPFACWEKRDYCAAQIPTGKEYTVKLTPIVFPGKEGGLELRGLTEIDAPLFVKDELDRNVLFLNGEIKDSPEQSEENEAFIKALRSSLSKNPMRLAVPQKERRGILLKNSAGCHARDIFEEPMPGNKYTRSFI